MGGEGYLDDGEKDEACAASFHRGFVVVNKAVDGRCGEHQSGREEAYYLDEKSVIIF